VPTIGRLIERAESASLVSPQQVKYEGKNQKWPGVQVTSKADETGTRHITALVLDPATLRIARLVWAETSMQKEEKSMIRLVVDFERLNAGEPLPAETFDFDPPKNAKLVDAVPIPGQTGSYLLNKPAPDFELKTLDGERIRLSELRGKPVLLNFWASWCGPCRRELPGLVRIHRDLQDKGLVVLGANDAGKAPAKKFANETNLSFWTIRH
jgi:AhpC/TSA family